MRVYIHFFFQLSFCLGSGLPVFEKKLGETEEIVSMRSVRIDRHRSLELPDGGGHIIGIAVGASKKDVQRSAVSGDLLHLFEDCDGSNFILRLPGLKQAHC